MAKLRSAKKNNKIITSPNVELQQNTESEIAKKEYKKTVKKYKRSRTIGLGATVYIELLIAFLMLGHIQVGNFQKRFDRESQLERNGVIAFETGEYSGDADFGIIKGTGEFDFETGTIYVGDWNENQFNGEGKLSVPSVGEYVGEFSASKKSGTGVFTWNDGTIYDGEWTNDRMNGNGTYTGANGVVYQGAFKDNAFDTGTCDFENETGTYHFDYVSGEIEQAVIIFSDGTKYSGGCSATDISGTGTITFSNKDSYKGSFENGVRNGNGSYYWNSGDKYEGEWADDKMSGAGNYEFENGNTLSGTFSDNSFISGTYNVTNDFGEYKFTIVEKEPTAVSIKLSDGTTYEGGMSEDGLNGSALISYSNGDKYDGNVKDGKKSGNGKYVWSNGAEYDGEWKKDKMNGTGTYMYPDNEEGYSLVGNFSKGVPDGDCTYYATQTEKYETSWSNGICVKVTE